MSQPMCRLGVLLSGRGSNFAAIQRAIEAGSLQQAQVAVVISDVADAPGLAFAESKGIPVKAFDKKNFETRQAFDEAVVAVLDAYQVDVVILAGYGRILTEPLLSRFENRILNIHPSLLPAYGGKGMLGIKVHQAVLANAEAESGCSVHLVTATVDGGPVLGQSRIPVLVDDTPETLAARILEQEHILYPKVIGEFIQKQLYQAQELNTHESCPLV